MSNGWIKLHRKFTGWQWYQLPGMVHLFIHLLLHANHEPKKWQKIQINRGQLVTGRKVLSAETGISEQSIRTILNNLKSTNEITIESTNRYSIITICNYNTYQNYDREDNQQINQQSNQQSTSSQPAINHKQECKELKELKNKTNIGVVEQLAVKSRITFKKPEIDEISAYATSIGFDLDGQTFFDWYESNGWKVGKNAMKDWKAAVRTWKQRNIKGKISIQEQNNKLIDSL